MRTLTQSIREQCAPASIIGDRLAGLLEILASLISTDPSIPRTGRMDGEAPWKTAGRN